MNSSMRNARKRRSPGEWKCLYASKRCFRDGLGGAARNAMEKSRVDEGEEGVTIIAGRADFSVASGRERSVID